MLGQHYITETGDMSDVVLRGRWLRGQCSTPSLPSPSSWPRLSCKLHRFCPRGCAQIFPKVACRVRYTLSPVLIQIFLRKWPFSIPQSPRCARGLIIIEIVNLSKFGWRLAKLAASSKDSIISVGIGSYVASATATTASLEADAGKSLYIHLVLIILNILI